MGAHDEQYSVAVVIHQFRGSEKATGGNACPNPNERSRCAKHKAAPNGFKGQKIRYKNLQILLRRGIDQTA